MPINNIVFILIQRFTGEVSKRRLGDLLLITALVLITFFVNSFLLTIPALSYVGDAQRYNGYQAYILKYSLEHFGQFALWDQFLSSGMSWISHPGGGQFSPTDWIVITFFKDPMFGSRMIFFIHTFTASLATYFFLRVIGLQKLTSFFISITSIANVYIFLFVANGWFEEFFGLTIIPLTTGLLLLALKRKSYLFTVLAAFSMSFHFFLNSYYVFHYHVIILLVILFLVVIKELINLVKDSKKKFNNLISFLFLNIIFWLVFVGISAIKLIPLLEFRNLSVRSQLPLSVVQSPGHILDTSVLYESLRYFFIDKSHTNWLSHWSNDIAVFLIIIAILYFLLKRSFIFWMFFTVLIVGIWGYLANKAPIDFYSLMYYLLPGFDSNNYPYRFIIVIRFAFLACIAMGLDIILRQKKNLFIKFLGLFLGIVMSIGVVSNMKPAYDGLTYTQDYEINNNYKAQNNNPENFLIVLKKIVKDSYPDGRVRATGFYPRAPVSNINSLRAQLPSVHHSYDPIVPTYQYGIILAGSAKDTLDMTRNRYKVFSVLNAKFQVQSNANFEYWGCSNLIPDTFEIKSSDPPSVGVCDFLENRLKLIYKDKAGAVFEDKDVLPKVTVIPNGVLLIGDNRLNDFSGFISKKLMFHPSFDEHKVSILSGGSSYIDDYNLDTLKQFRAVILVDSKIRDKEKADRLLSSYKDKGGNVVELHSIWNEYEYLHKRSDSLYTNNPAWNYSKEDGEKLASVFDLFNSFENAGRVEIRKFTPEESIYKITTNKDNQIFQFSDSFYPGWKAEIDGKKTQIFMADGLVKSVILPERGVHTVRFYYAPDSLRNGAVVSLSTILITVFLLLLYYKRNLLHYTKRLFKAKSTMRRSLYEKLKTLKKILVNNPNFYLGALVLLVLICIYFPVFSNTITSAGDLPYYFETYIKSLSIPQLWNPHWQTGLGGNQTIILPLKLYVQLPIAVFINFFSLMSWELVEKIFLFGVFILLSIYSSYFLTRSWIGTLIYSSNTYILMVFSGGQMGVALSYAIVPLVVALFIKLFEEFKLRLIIVSSIIFSLQIIFDQRIAYLTFLAVLIYSSLKLKINSVLSWTNIKKRSFLIILIPISIFLLNAFWIVPLLYSKLVGINALQVIAKSTGEVGFFSFAFLENTIALLHPNFPENIFGKIYFMKPEYLVIPIIAYFSLFFVKENKKILFFVVLGLTGAFLSKGANEPFGEIYVWLFNNFPGFSFFRDPTKFYIFIALSYSVLIPFALKELSKRLRENLRTKGLFILTLVFLIFWIFTIRYVFLNQVGGLFKEFTYPEEYTKLKIHFESNQDFSRSLWLPARSRFGYFSDIHPAIDGYDLFGRIGEGTMAAHLKKPEVINRLQEMSIKYVIVPYDSEGEIFTKDRIFDEDKYEEMKNGLLQIPELKLISNFGQLVLFELQSPKDHFFIVSSGKLSSPLINYQALSPVKYLINIKSAKSGDILVFSESYDLGWQLRSAEVKIFPVPYKNNLNGFVLPNDGDYVFELFYTPQKAGDIGYVISLISFLSFASVLVILRVKK